MKDIIISYRENKELYQLLTKKNKALIEDLLEDQKINVHNISARVKKESKLQEKIKRKNNKYKSLFEITDISGIRIITYFEDDVDRIAKIIEQEFKIDSENSIDKRIIESKKFGYMSLHYVANIGDNRIKLAEYKKFKDIKFEIQIRSILQHSWAEIEHDIGYKGTGQIPLFAERSFSRIAALLEIADIEFIRLRNQLSSYQEEILNLINENIHTEKVLIDKISLVEFIKSNKTVYDIDKEIANELQWSFTDSYYFIDNVAERFLTALNEQSSVEINNLMELDKLLINHKDEIVSHAAKANMNDQGNDEMGLTNGSSLEYLLEYLKKSSI